MESPSPIIEWLPWAATATARADIDPTIAQVAIKDLIVAFTDPDPVQAVYPWSEFVAPRISAFLVTWFHTGPVEPSVLIVEAARHTQPHGLSPAGVRLCLVRNSRNRWTVIRAEQTHDPDRLWSTTAHRLAEAIVRLAPDFGLFVKGVHAQQVSVDDPHAPWAGRAVLIPKTGSTHDPLKVAQLEQAMRASTGLRHLFLVPPGAHGEQ